MSMEKNLAQSEETLNQYVSEGWELQQIITPNDLSGALIAVLYREKQFDNSQFVWAVSFFVISLSTNSYQYIIDYNNAAQYDEEKEWLI